MPGQDLLYLKECESIIKIGKIRNIEITRLTLFTLHVILLFSNLEIISGEII